MRPSSGVGQYQVSRWEGEKSMGVGNILGLFKNKSFWALDGLGGCWEEPREAPLKSLVRISSQ